MIPLFQVGKLHDNLNPQKTESNQTMTKEWCGFWVMISFFTRIFHIQKKKKTVIWGFRSAGTLKPWPQPQVGRDLTLWNSLGVCFFGGSKCSFDFSTPLKKWLSYGASRPFGLDQSVRVTHLILAGLGDDGFLCPGLQLFVNLGKKFRIGPGGSPCPSVGDYLKGCTACTNAKKKREYCRNLTCDMTPAPRKGTGGVMGSK